MRLILAIALAAMLSLGASQPSRAQDDGVDPGSTAFNNGDYAKAMEIWRAKADQGDPEAMTNVANLLYLGFAGKRNLPEAAAWYEKAAQLGFVTAQYNLANFYYDGTGVSRDHKQAARWYTAAALGGHAKAQFYLAQMYEDGDGVKQDKVAALQWYQKAVDQDLAEAEYTLGNKLIYGDGVAQDPTKGSDLVLKAAEQRYVKAQILMANVYWLGKGIPKNLIEAYVWASQAVENAKLPHDQKRAEDLFGAIKSNMTAEQVKAAEIELTAVNPNRRKDKAKQNSSGDNPSSDGQP